MDSIIQNINTQSLLIIDDDEASRILISEIFEGENINIIEARSGAETLYLFKKYSKEIGLVFLDIKLPDCCGWDLVSQLKKENNSVPVIAVSATNPVELRERFEIAGFDSYLSKPFDIADLIRIVEFYLEQRSISI